MRQILKDIWISKKIFIMLLIGFLLTILPILIAFSTQSYYDDRFYDSKSGYFKYYYSIHLTNMTDLDLYKIKETARSDFENSSVITGDIGAEIPKIGLVTIIGLVNNKNWDPPLIKGTKIESNESNSIIVGKLINSNIGTMKLFDNEYNVKGICGKSNGEEYNFKIYVPLNSIPESIKQGIRKQNDLQLIVRSNQNPEKEINKFISYVKQDNQYANVQIVNETVNYETEKNSREGVKEVLSFPYKLFVLALINCIIVSYFWIYMKRKDISLRKALGASKLNLFSFIFCQLIVVAVFATICSILMQWVLSKLNNYILHFTFYNISLSFYDFLISILITLAISMITSIIPFIHIMKIEPAKALKE